MRMRRVSIRAAAPLLLAGVLLAAMIAAAVPAGANEHGPLAPIVRASMRTAATLQTPPRETPGEAQGGTLGRFGSAANQAIYGFNVWLFDGWNALRPSGPPSAARAAIGSAASNLFLNWINEPITIASYMMVGRLDEAGISGRRFLVNTFRGWGGTLDRATEMGLVVPHIDLGLALCALGTPAGPYAVFPVVGPRTLRDGIADLVAVNGIVYLALAPLGTPIGTIVLIVVADEIVHLAMMRQIDAVATEDTAARGFEEVRAAYLADREARCAQLRDDGIHIS